jgi:hypothetical protein
MQRSDPMQHEWRRHPRLAGRFHPEGPDDVQILVHDGGPRLTDRRPELVWARVLAVDSDVFHAEVLNQPVRLTTVRKGDRVQFVVPASGDNPVMVRPKYLEERSKWIIGPCSQCGLSELLDAPSDLIAKVFPNLKAGEVVDGFTAICGVCGGVQTVASAFADSEDRGTPSVPRKWWQFWK